MNRRVVVTGLGTVSPLGISVRSSWNNLISGGSGIKKLSGGDYEKIPCRIAGLVNQGEGPEQLNVLKYVNKADMRSLSLATIFALVSSAEALEDARWFPEEESKKEMTGVCIGMGMADLNSIYETAFAFKTGYSKVSPFFVPKILTNMPAGQVSIKYGFRGPNHTVSTACATGSHAIGDAFKFIQNGQADVMVCGGTEASVNPLAMAGFCRLRALSTSFNDTPSEASRPFDQKREGFVMGEGAAILILEEMNHALERGSHIYGEILGYGLSGDASHMTAPHEEGVGAVLAMKRALSDAKTSPADISYINAHATSTPLGDAIELKAISKIFKDNLDCLKVSSTKGAHGHLLGAAGNLETLFTVLACQHGTVPPTLNLNDKCVEGNEINCVPNTKQEWATKKRIALKNSFGFGGTNASLCLSNFIL
ncbi:3-oxoacyl-[acyl-carrier-protein] synthase, mitochondrial [Cimex lectularius]|uniref:3-oxoacyl-[acyl-carrier-protein] synthase n=1 Tax=Cimex lectularius TaxID=79782 RepID=A0A8I6R830_CIMLE|nr:3-oxoacyl-[acyl-carrier-protein] synthase, mitochondrial [Cimex lectularius]